MHKQHKQIFWNVLWMQIGPTTIHKWNHNTSPFSHYLYPMHITYFIANMGINSNGFSFVIGWYVYRCHKTMNNFETERILFWGDHSIEYSTIFQLKRLKHVYCIVHCKAFYETKCNQCLYALNIECGVVVLM